MRIFLLALLPAALCGHDLYLKPERCIVAGGERLRVEYHNGDSFPVSQAPVRLERLRDAKRVAAEGEAPFEDLRVEGKTTVGWFTAPAAGHFYLVSRTIPNFIELAPEKFEKYLQHEGLRAVSRWRRQHGEAEKPGREFYSKYVKSLLVAERGDGSFSRPTGLTLEFVPLADPYAAAAGGQIPVQLLFRGQPAAGHRVELHYLAEGQVHRAGLGATDAQGMVAVPVPKAGFYKLHTIVMERREDRSQADWESFWTTLTFAAGGAQR
jgi:uncharacterized GH25 family protein